MGNRPQVAYLSDTRLTVPLPSVRQALRPRMTCLLDAAVRQPITLVTSRPGTGKTAAVAAWAVEGSTPGPVAWVTVDRVLRTPFHFWSAVSSALDRAIGGMAVGLNLPLRPLEVVDDAYIEALSAAIADQTVVLVLDDVHELSQEVLTGLDQLLRLPPAGLHVILIGRRDPGLSLHRHRVAGRLGELHAADLDFTEQELRQLVDETGLDLPDGTVDTLMRTTQGWAAGLRLAVLAMAASGDPASAAHQFGGHQALVHGYLREELLDHLPPERGEFLSRTSIASRICAPLAHALTGSEAAGESLHQLVGEDLLIAEPGEDGWYRHHPLLRQALQAKLAQGRPDLRARLHQRASIWFEEHGEPTLALEHAIESGDHQRSVAVVLRSAATAAFVGDSGELGRLIERIPRDGAPHDPELQVVLAVGALCRGDDRIAQMLLDRAAPDLVELPEPRRSVATLTLRATEASVAGRHGDAEAMAASAAAAQSIAYAVTVDQAPGWSGLRGLPVGMHALGDLWSGRVAAAIAGLEQSAYPDASAYPPGVADTLIGGHLALALALQGEIEPARVKALAVLEQAEHGPEIGSFVAATAWYALACARVHQGDSAGALAALSSGEQAMGRWPDPFVAVGYELVRVRHALLVGDLDAARRALVVIDQELQERPGMAYAVRLRAGLGVEVELLAGSVDRAQHLLSAYDETVRVSTVTAAAGERDPLVFARALLLLACGRPQDVEAVVAGELGSTGWIGAGAWLALAMAQDRMRHDALATEAMARALDLAAPHRVVLPFRRVSPRLAAMLRRHDQVVGTHRDFVRTLLAGTQELWGEDELPVVPGTAEDLTERELAVLAYLPTMSSNAEIAVELGISVNTVKQHLKSVHRKLGVTTRRDAARAARRLDLLP